LFAAASSAASAQRSQDAQKAMGTEEQTAVGGTVDDVELQGGGAV